MITEIVTFRIDRSKTRADVVALYEKSAAVWRQNASLALKSYLYDPEAGIGGGVYLWDSIAAARAAHDESFRARVLETFGSAPEFRYFETPVLVDNRAAAAPERN